MDILTQIAFKIIKEQESIIGPLAWDEAKKVQGLNITENKEEGINFTEDKKEVLDRLVAQYERLFGKASREVCHDAVSNLIAEIPQAEVPASLR